MRALLTVVSILCFSMGQVAIGDTPSTPTTPTTPPSRGYEHATGTTKRQEGLRDIPSPILDWIATNFKMSKEFVSDRWKDDTNGSQDSLPEALSRMEAKDDSRIAGILAQMMGTLNPELYMRSTEAAREELAKLALSEPPELSPKDAQKKLFLERVLFALYSWPEKKDKSKAFCLAPIDELNAKQAADSKAGKESDSKDVKDFASYAEHTIDTGKVAKPDGTPGDDDINGRTDAFFDKMAAMCYGKKEGGKWSNASYAEFIRHFEPAASKVWEHNLAFHGKLDKFAASTDPAEKGKVAKEIADTIDVRSLTAAAEQQRRSNYDVIGKDGIVKNRGQSLSNAMLQVAGWNQNGNTPSRELALTIPGVGDIVAKWDGKPKADGTWDGPTSPSAAVEAALKAANQPYEADKPVPNLVENKKITEQLAATRQQAQAASQQADAAAAAEKLRREEAARQAQQQQQQLADSAPVVTDAKFQPASAAVTQACTSCHGAASTNQKATAKFSVADFSKMTKTQLQRAAAHADRMRTEQGASIDKTQIDLLNEWAAATK